MAPQAVSASQRTHTDDEWSWEVSWVLEAGLPATLAQSAGGGCGRLRVPLDARTRCDLRGLPFRAGRGGGVCATPIDGAEVSTGTERTAVARLAGRLSGE